MADAILGCDILTGFGEDDLWSYLNNVDLGKVEEDPHVDPFEGIDDIDLNFSPSDIDLLFWHGTLLESELRDDVMWSSPSNGLAVSPRTLSPVEDRSSEVSLIIKQEIKEEPEDIVEEKVHSEEEEEIPCYSLDESAVEIQTYNSFKKEAESTSRRQIQQQGCSTSGGASTSRRRTVVVQKSRSVLRKVKKEETVMLIKQEEEDYDEEGHIKQSVVPEDQHYAASEAFARQVASLQTNPYLTAARFDHNYDMKKRIKTDDLGVQTPSDTEKEDEGYSDESEADVLSTPPYSEWTPSSSPSPHSKSTSVSRNSIRLGQKKRIKTLLPKRNLPYNPSRQRRHELEESVAYSFEEISVKNRMSPKKRKLNDYEYKHNNGSQTADERDEEEDEYEEEDSDYETGYSSEQGGRVSSSNIGRGKRIKFSNSWNSEEEKRAYHNQMERKRRQDLKSNLDRLKSFIPSLKNDPRASKQSILNHAVPVLSKEERIDQECMRTKENLRQRQAVLKREVRRLRKLLRHLREQKCMSETPFY